MKSKARASNLDPRIQYVPEKYSFLAMDFLNSTKQNEEYWNSVSSPITPSNRIAFEELRQMAVFFPLIPVVIAYDYFGKVAAGVVFFIALLLMRNLHLKIQHDMRRKWNAWIDRDQGRYTFTQFMCNEFDLQPQDVTLALVERMASHFLLLVQARKRLQEEENKSSITSSHHGYLDSGKNNEHENRLTRIQRTEICEIGDANSAVNSVTDDVWTRINPATGLPMLDECSDVHGNVFGTSYMDDMWAGNHSPNFGESNDFVVDGGNYSYDNSGI